MPYIAEDLINIRESPTLRGRVIGQQPRGSQVEVEPRIAVLEDGYYWRKLSNREGWIAERNASGTLILLRNVDAPIDLDDLQPPTPDPAPTPSPDPDPAPSPPLEPLPLPPALPTPPQTFTNGDLINAFFDAAAQMGEPSPADWVDAAGLRDLVERPREVAYNGPAIADLPNLSLEQKLLLIHALKVIVQGQAGLDAPAPPEASAFSTGNGEVDLFPDVKNTSLSPFTTQGMQILYQGKPFRFIGVNMRELAWYDFPHLEITRHAREKHIDQQLEAAFQMRAQVVRFFAPVRLLGDGRAGTDVQEAIRRGKLVLDKLAAKNMFALITLSDAKWSGLSVAEDNNRYRQPKDIYNRDFYQGGYRERYLPFVQQYVAALGDHPAIFAWGIGNEMQVNPHPPEPSDFDNQKMLDFFRHVSEELRQRSPKKLITTGVESSYHLFVLNAYDQAKYSSRLYQLPTIDFATLHSYQGAEIRNDLGHNTQFIQREAALARQEWNVPLVMEELGPTGGRNRGDGAVWVRSTVTQLFQMGFSGVMQWAFSGVEGDIGVGDASAGMHNTGKNAALVGHDWQSLFNTYREFGSQFWVNP